MLVRSSNTAAGPKTTEQSPGPTSTTHIRSKVLLAGRDDTTRITITQTLPRTLSTRTATVTLHGDVPTSPPPHSSNGVSDQQLGAIIGATCATIFTLLILGCCVLRRRRQKKSFVKSQGKGNSPMSSPPFRPPPWSPRSSAGPGGRRASKYHKSTSSSSTTGESVNSAHRPPSRDFGVPKPPPSTDRGPPRSAPKYTFPPTGPTNFTKEPASGNYKQVPTSLGKEFPDRFSKTPVSTNDSPDLDHTADGQKRSKENPESWTSPSSTRHKASSTQSQPLSMLSHKMRSPHVPRSGPVNTGMTTALPVGHPSAGTTSKPRHSGNIQDPAYDSNTANAVENNIPESRINRHASGSSVQGRPGMISSINKIPRATSSFQEPPIPVLPGPFTGNLKKKKQVEFQQIIEEPIPEGATERSSPSNSLEYEKQSSVKGRKRSSIPENQHKIRPKAPLEDPIKPEVKSKDAHETHTQADSPVKSTPGVKSPPSRTHSRVPSPGTIGIDEQHQPDLVNETASESDPTQKVNDHNPVAPAEDSKSTPPIPDPKAQLPEVINVNPGPVPPRASSTLGHTVNPIKSRDHSKLKSFLEGRPGSRRPSLSVPGPAHTASHQHAATYPDNGYYHNQGETSNYRRYPVPATREIVTETTELPQARRVQAAGRRGRQSNRVKNKVLIYFSGRDDKGEKKDRKKRSPSRRRPSERDG
ncbi:hypothetical protein CNYM01_05424 [Colletotrichum nymphaeae SA-01]|uniref:Uncharacterized protein n=1 Tax=Colletotrichum nymphaeae SA-01 TaxID=1460502 RepID=A0A135UST5_9PEZI|nr:hypothetical protein CNYM01_05424 [Colletotrichum nymphaeae SA-01]